MNTNNNEIWVFLSHSLDDYDKVRLVRNLLEDDGFRPIMFFLKAFEDNPDDEMLKTLLRNEIDSRKRFILCKSQHTSPPKRWVKFENDYILNKDRKEFHHFYYQVIDIEKPIEEIKKQLALFRRNSTVYISYSSNDQQLYEFLKNHFENTLDFKVFDWTSLTSGQDFAKTLKIAIADAVANGVFIPVITNNSLSSDFVLTELEYAITLNPERVIPFCHSEIDHSFKNLKRFQKLIMHRNWIEFNDCDMNLPLELLSLRIQELSSKE